MKAKIARTVAAAAAIVACSTSFAGNVAAGGVPVSGNIGGAPGALSFGLGGGAGGLAGQIQEGLSSVGGTPPGLDINAFIGGIASGNFQMPDGLTPAQESAVAALVASIQRKARGLGMGSNN